ncbi:MAG: FAD-dependent monooxygenase [Chloroflexota bacterium]|nr:MAG: FAD-dependent monooxygenase [Chloroflexota bacterium]
MEQVESIDVLIVGSGPAGASTALHLLQHDRSWADRIMIVDKAIHPREKLCGGGITHMGQNILARLGLTIETPSFAVREAKIVYGSYSFSFKGNPVFRVIRRDEFDHWLVQKAEARGVTVRQGEAVLSVTAHDEYVEVQTSKSLIRAKVLVAADGSRSTVRSKLKWDDDSRVARLLEILTPEDARLEPEFQDAQAIFDFTPTADGLQGYYWDFPSYVAGEPFMNRGVFDSRARPERPKIDLVGELRQSLAERDRDLDDYKLKGHPIRWFDENGRFAIPRVLLAGDAAGADPLVGEGISFALAYGDAAAASITDAFQKQDFSFAGYRQRVLDHSILKQLPTRTRLARIAYHYSKYRLVAAICWRIVGFSIRFSKWKDPDYSPVEAPKLVYES